MLILKWIAQIIGMTVLFTSTVLANNPCHRGVPVNFASSSLQAVQKRIEIENKYGFFRPESINELMTAQQNLFKEYARMAASDFGFYGNTKCFEYLSMQQWGQKLRLTSVVSNSVLTNKWLVFINEKPSMNPAGETAEDIFNRIGFFIQRAIYPDEYIVSLIIEVDQSNYEGSCPCPYNIDSTGDICGARSAYNQLGGKKPICFSTDVTQLLIESTRRAVFKSVYLPS